MFSNHLQHLVLHPTHITDKTLTLIDNIFVDNAIGSNIQSGNVLSLISDHLPQFCIISELTCDYKNLSHKTYDYSHFYANMFLADYAETIFSIADVNSDLNDKFDKFLLNLLGLVNRHCPLEWLSRNRLKLKNKPWIKHILKMMRIRDKLFKRFKAANSTNDLRMFKLFGNCIVNQLKECKRNYYHQYFDQNKSKMKMLWKGIKSIVTMKPNNLGTITHLTDISDSHIKDPVKIADQFNYFFYLVLQIISQRITQEI